MAELSLVNFSGFNQYEAVTGAKTLDEGDSGVVQNVTASATVTLPATVAGATYVVRVGAEGITVNVSPNAADKIMGNGFTSADNKDAIATSQPIGSYIALVADGANGWQVQRVHGTWTREA